MNRSHHTFTQKTLDDPATRALTAHEIIAYLKDKRVIIGLDTLRSQFPGRTIPIELLSNDKEKRVEVSFENDRFIYIPIITREYHTFLTNIQDLRVFLTKHPVGISLGDFFDAYHGVEADLELLAETNQIIIINPDEKAKKRLADGTEMDDFETTTGITSQTTGKPPLGTIITENDGNISATPALKIKNGDKRVVYSADYWLHGYKHLDQRYIDLWQDYPLPHESTSMTNYLKETGHEVLPPKATR